MYMKRLNLDDLIRWKSSPTRKPLIIRGARQVGKTWLMREFGKQHYRQVAYVNFENNSAMKNLFTQDFDINRVLLGIQIETGITVDPDHTLIIFDEIQDAPSALTSLKYFHENAPEYSIVCAGSLLGVAMHQHTSFPVGKVDFLDLHPLTFIEFLLAQKEDGLVDLLQRQDWTLINSMAPKYIDHLRRYYYIGGMPEVVLAFSRNRDFDEVRSLQKQILMAYEHDFSKHAPSTIVPRIRMVWNSIPAQLSKENRKFVYGILRQGARAKEYELALAWLRDCGLVYQVHNVTKPAIPLKAYEDLGAFKLYMVDVGLLAALADLDIRTLLDGNHVFQEFKGALTEQYVLQQMVSQHDAGLYYWSLDNSRAEIDFLLQRSGEIIPLEVKAEENLKSKSLRVYCDKYQPKTALRTSMADYRLESWMRNIPLYAISVLQMPFPTENSP